MYRFFSQIQNISDNKIIISDRNQVHHIRDVLRLKKKDAVVIFDNKANEYITDIERFSPQSIILKIKEKYQIPAKNTKITIACAIPKKSKMDDIVDKLTQLGVDRIIPMLTKRVIIKLDKERGALRLKRWQRIAMNASLQSQRNMVPIIEPIREIAKVLSEAQDFDLKLMPTLIGERRLLKEVFAKPKPKNILVLIGPEGDFTEEEVNLAKESGFIPVSLGDLVLRVETAAIAVASFIRLYENH